MSGMKILGTCRHCGEGFGWAFFENVQAHEIDCNHCGKPVAQAMCKTTVSDQLRALARRLSYNDDDVAAVKHRLFEIAMHMDVADGSSNEVMEQEFQLYYRRGYRKASIELETKLRALYDSVTPGGGHPNRGWNDIARDGQRQGIEMAIQAVVKS